MYAVESIIQEMLVGYSGNVCRYLFTSAAGNEDYQ